MKLVVVEPFHDYKRGDVITDGAEAERVLAEHPRHVIVAPDDPVPPKKSKVE